MQGYAASSDIQMQALRKELDAANKKNNRYAHLVAMLTEELGDLRRSICYNCKKKFVPSYVPVPSSDEPRPSLWRRIISGHSPSSAVSPVSTISTTNVEVSSNSPIPIHSSFQNHETTAILALPQASSVIDEIQSKQVVWSVSHNPEIKQALHIDLVKTFDFPAKVISVQFSPDGKYLGLNGESGKTYIYDVETGLKICFLVDLYLQDQPRVRCVQFSPDNKYIATGSDTQVRVWEIARKRSRATFTDHRWSANTLCFSPNGRSIVSGDGFGGVRIWSLRDGSSRKLLDDVSTILSVTFSPDGRHIAAVDADGWLRIWDARTGQLLDTWNGHTYLMYCVAFTPDGKGLVSGGGDNTLRYWDISSLAVMKRGRMITGTLGQRFQQIRVFEGHSAIIRSVSFSHDHRWVVTSSEDNTLRIWDPHTARWYCTVHGHNDSPVAVGFSPAGTYLASGGFDRQVRLWRYREV